MNRCVMCGAQGTLREGHTEHRLTRGGVSFVTELPAEVCDACGESYTALGVLGGFELAVSDWLTAHGHCTPETFRFVRKALGLRAVDLGELLDVAPETISRWENGKLSISAATFALMGALVANRLEGRDDTIQRLQALKAPAKAPRKAVRLELPKAG